VLDERLQRRVGAIALILLVAAVVLFLRFEGEHLRPGIVIHVELERLGAMVEGGPVVLAGREIGQVDRIRLLPRRDAAPYAQDPTAERARIVLDVWIDRRWAAHVRERSELFQNQPSILSSAYLEVGPPRDGGDAGPPLKHGAVIRGVDPPRLDHIAQRSYENLKQVIELVRNGLPESRLLGHELDQLSQNLDALAAPGEVEAMTEAHRRLWREGVAAIAFVDQTGVTGADLDRVGGRTDAILARESARFAELRVKIDRLSALLEEVAPRLDPARYAKFSEVLGRAEAIALAGEALLGRSQELALMLERGEGTIGAFMKDTELFDELKAMTKILKERPWETVGHPLRRRPGGL
jgi:phospholipid/cholesterol/gamma-HCH transport system substrate-binding protein